MKTITRLRPNDLQEVQKQTADDAAISDVIVSLQSGRSTEEKPLNTACPTCQVNGIATGFLKVTVKGTELKYPCPTCLGYLLINTQEGALEPPVNPFEAALDATSLLPADLTEAIAAFAQSGTLAAMIISLQGNTPVGISRANDCPLCNVNGKSTGWITVQETKVICPLCVGYQKTGLHYQVQNGVISEVVPDQPPPEDPFPLEPQPPLNPQQ